MHRFGIRNGSSAYCNGVNLLYTFLINYPYVFVTFVMLLSIIILYNNNNNNCLKSNIQCIEIRVQWTVHASIRIGYSLINI